MMRYHLVAVCAWSSSDTHCRLGDELKGVTPAKTSPTKVGVTRTPSVDVQCLSSVLC